jgi:hypothetical protein
MRKASLDKEANVEEQTTDIDIDESAQIKKHQVHVGENRRERRLREKREGKENGLKYVSRCYQPKPGLHVMVEEPYSD